MEPSSGGSMQVFASFIGGGIRGAFSARLFERCQEIHPGLQDAVQAFAGTSTGALCATTLAKGLPPSAVLGLYRNHGPAIFGKRDWLDSVTHADELFRANFSTEALTRALASVFGNDRLAELLPKQVLIPTFDLDNHDLESKATATRAYKYRHWKPKILTNAPGPGSDGSILVVDACLRSSAAPTYFRSHQGYVDGGMVANNPVMCLIVEMKKQGIPLEEMAVLSIGTGFNPHYIEGHEHDWGYRQWLPKLLPMVFDGMIGLPDHQARQLLNHGEDEGPYLHLDAALKDVIDLADVHRIDELVDYANRVDLDPFKRWLDGMNAA